jgi:ferredoxin--NADP+ reductase
MPDAAGDERRRLRIAIIGSGPAGFYAAESLLRSESPAASVDMFERLPAPFGLVRFGVAPDHQKIKRAAAAFERTAAHERFRFFGNVEVGRDLTLSELRAHYDQVLVAIGAATARGLGIPGEDLAGSHAATSFVGWYNGHPDHRQDRYDLSTQRAVVVGVGNVALDVSRILVRSADELARTDIAPYAIEALRSSRIREVVVLGRRGPAQAAFDAVEIKDIAELADVQVTLEPRGILDEPWSENAEASSATRHAIAELQRIVAEPKRDTSRRVVLRFLATPVELIGERGIVSGIRIERNVLDSTGGEVRARGTGVYEMISAGLVLRAIGYRGVALPGVPFDERRGVVPNREGRVVDGEGALQPGLYVTGWIKRGPSGLIGANKPDAHETVAHMLSDAAAGPIRHPTPDIEPLLAARQVRVVTFQDWRRLDELERAAGERLGKVREKFCSVDEMLRALTREEHGAGNTDV